MDQRSKMKRRDFLQRTAVVGATVTGSAIMPASGYLEAAEQQASQKIRVGIIGCGSVSGVYLPHLSRSPHVQLVSMCDIIPERAQRRAKEFDVAEHYPHIDQMLAGAAFDLLVNLTDMQEHEQLNRRALESGKHVWSEKPIANTLATGQELLRMAQAKKTAALGRTHYRAEPSVRVHGQATGRGKAGARGCRPCGLWARGSRLVRFLL